LADDAFCNRKIYEQVFLENEHFIAVYNLRPMLPGHCLVIPKRHVLEVLELSDREMVSLLRMMKCLMPKLLKAFGASTYNLSINGGPDAGQVVPHLHIHVIPRNKNDLFQRKTLQFYRRLEDERPGYIKDVSKEIGMLRKVFRYPLAGKA
jgi:diadenosine tetraphosphate (Ap4A) HIT family hydrolase